ncbi:MAG: hypothetical protein WC353_02300 [Candidatus Peribacter sp.]
MSQGWLACPQCKKETLRPFRIIPRKEEPDVLQQFCQECDYPFSAGERLVIRELPPIRRKKIIYLDQNIIGEITGALHPKPKFPLSIPEKQRAMEIFSKLDYLRKGQCLACPYSWDHRGESVVATNVTPNSFRDLMRVFRYLANDIRFEDSFRIKVDQILRFAQKWVGEKSFETLQFASDHLFETNPHHWYWEERGPFSYILMEGEAEERIKIIDDTYENILDVYREWKNTPEDKITEDESLAFSKDIFKQYKKELILKLSVLKGRKIEELKPLIPDSRFHAELLWALQRIFDKEEGADRGMRKKDVFASLGLDPIATIPLEFIGFFERLIGLPIRYVPEIKEMFESEEFRRYIPFIRNESVMNAYLGKVTKGRTKDIGKGEMTDINRIAYHLPYCDAIVTDEFWSKAFANKFITDRIHVKCRFFHLKDYRQFMAYLSEVEKEYKDQIELARSYLGDIDPTMTLLGKRSNTGP